jgi:hypothetical protein
MMLKAFNLTLLGFGWATPSDIVEDHVLRRISPDTFLPFVRGG